MSNGRSSKLWMVNVISFILFIILCSTGLLNWLVLPRGYEARGSFLVSLRHFFIAFHEWAALVFMMGCRPTTNEQLYEAVSDCRITGHTSAHVDIREMGTNQYPIYLVTCKGETK